MIKRFIQIALLSLVLCPVAFAQMNISCEGAKQIVHGKDTLFFFNGDINVSSKIGDVHWYSIETGELLATAPTDAQYKLDDGGYYIEQGGVEYSPFYVFKYAPTDSLSLSVVPDCDATTVTVSGNTKPYTYKRRDGSNATYARACTLFYNELAWDNEQWIDSAATTTGTLHEGNYILPALYGATPITLCYDLEIRTKFGLDSACVQTELKEQDVKAVKMLLTSLATARGSEGEKSNERNRPTSQKLIASSEYSGALEVAFYSNPTPAALYYRWDVYKASEHLVTRNDRDIRYNFVAPGSYRVVCSVNNASCKSDSAEMTVAIAESYLAVPNVFTPNGDGKNDEFRVAYRSLREFHCWVYNRWGKLVYEWTDPAKGWDGTIGGRPAAEGAYFYVIRALGTDAAKDAKYRAKAAYEKKKNNSDESVIGVYQLSGDINLLRGKR